MGCSYDTCKKEKKQMHGMFARGFKLTLEGESVFLESRKALLLSGSRSRSAADRSMIREWSFCRTNGRTHFVSILHELTQQHDRSKGAEFI